ncbi:hypothetical protein ACJDU8_24485 [Clostridium sp. WILCCON 0269]|uniref:DUF1648 domain-containing protein n=1 Tax=Candidatus Clostridium eludens TaxID=3381663 RepID=A0ABW8SRM0_9CLOT
METQQTLTNITFRKIPYILTICPCLLLIAYSRSKLSALLKSIPHDDLFNFVWIYMKSDSHQVFLILALILLIIAPMSTSTYLLIKKFEDEEKQGKILSVILILSNISVIIITILSSLILFKIISTIILVSFLILLVSPSIGPNRE